MEKKICPNCGMQMHKNFCMHCGYMENGNFISKKPIKAKDIEHYLGKDYDKIIRNENFIAPLILGPVYILAHNFYLEGILFILVDTLITLLIEILNHSFILYYVVKMFNVIYVVINRLLWSAIANIIYIKLLDKRIKRIKEKNPDIKGIELEYYYKKDKKIIGLKYICFFLIFLIIFYMIQGIVYQYLQLM